MTRKTFRQPLLWFSIAAVAIALAWPRLSKKDRFPYVGTWQGDTVVAPGYGSRISFNDDGSCTHFFTTPKNIQPQSCSYEMRGSKALVTNIEIEGNSKRFFQITVEPRGGENALLFAPIDVTTYDKKGRRNGYHRFTDPAYVLRKVK